MCTVDGGLHISIFYIYQFYQQTQPLLHYTDLPIHSTKKIVQTGHTMKYSHYALWHNEHW